MESQLAAGTPDELAVVLQASAHRALDLRDGRAFIEWFCEVVPILAPVFVAPFGEDVAARRSALYALGRLLWNRLPLPANHFRPLPLDKPQRNDPCPCGSGPKYKHCCARAESVADPFENVSLLDYVLRTYPRTELRKLPWGRLDLVEIAFIGNEWCREGHAADAEALLEPIFDDVARLDERAEPAFDALADCYTELGRTGKKARLVERVGGAHNPTLRSAALHRRITMVADQGKRAEAWRLFGEAQRHQPDNPMLATLEITLLLEAGEHERVRERARFWIGRLSLIRGHEHADLLAHLRKMAADPVEAILEIECVERPGLADLRQAIATWPPIACHYRVDRTDSGVWLEADPVVQELEARWQQAVDVDEPDLTTISTGDPQALEHTAAGIRWLRNEPVAAQSFEVLDTLARVVRDAGLMAGRDLLLEPILERGRALLRFVLEQNGISDECVPWAVLDNRPALRLIAALFYLRLEQARADDALEIARWMVCTLNPNDNHGLREELTRLLLAAEDAAGALGICDRYPDDLLLGTQLDRVLALFILGRHDDAAAAMGGVAARSPDALPMLLAAAPKRPKGEGPYLRLGSKEEAWLYRENHRDLWERAGAMDWARATNRRSRTRPA